MKFSIPNDLEGAPTERAPARALTEPVASPVPADLFAPSTDSEASLSCSEFFDLLKVNQVTTIEQALAAIEKVKPKYLTRTLYAYATTMAFDGASFVYPRAITYGGDAKMILNFSGNNRQKGFERIELVCFNDLANKFEFSEVVFPKEARNSEALSDLTPSEKVANYVHIPGGRGVRECAKCHETPSRPNWDIYALWPNFYGATNDSLKDPDRPDERAIYSSFEDEMWKLFQKKAAKVGRYAWTSQILSRPNSDFTLRVSYLNGRRIVGDLKRAGEPFRHLRYDFAKAMFCAPSAERRLFESGSGQQITRSEVEVLPDPSDSETKELFLSSYYDEMQKEQRLGAILSAFGLPSPLPKERIPELRAHYRNLFQNDDLNFDFRLTRVDVDEVLMISAMKKVTDKIGIDIENWSMVRDGGFVHENGLGYKGRVALRLILERPFVQEFLSDDDELKKAIELREKVENSGGEAREESAKICSLLAKRTSPSAQ